MIFDQSKYNLALADEKDAGILTYLITAYMVKNNLTYINIFMDPESLKDFYLEIAVEDIKPNELVPLKLIKKEQVMEGKVAVDIKNVEAVFTLINKLAEKEVELLKEIIISDCIRWTSIASENILNKLSGFNPQERNSLKVATEKEILQNRFKEVFLDLYNKGINKK